MIYNNLLKTLPGASVDNRTLFTIRRNSLLSSEYVIEPDWCNVHNPKGRNPLRYPIPEFINEGGRKYPAATQDVYVCIYLKNYDIVYPPTSNC